MKINPIVSHNIIQSYRSSKTLPTAGPKSLGGTDEVSFSQEAKSFSKLMTELREQVRSGSADQLERVRLLKAEVQNGSYRIDSDRLAESILNPRRED